MERVRLNKYFHQDEFACKCGCGICNIDPEFLHWLTVAREIADVPFVINSGCRCPSHNKTVGGTVSSPHITTEAIKARGADVKAEKIEVMSAILHGAIVAGIHGIGFGLGFIHLDTKARMMIKCYAAFRLTRRGLTLG